jgi:hypothetical protein
VTDGLFHVVGFKRRIMGCLACPDLVTPQGIRFLIGDTHDVQQTLVIAPQHIRCPQQYGKQFVTSAGLGCKSANVSITVIHGDMIAVRQGNVNRFETSYGQHFSPSSNSYSAVQNDCRFSDSNASILLFC